MLTRLQKRLSTGTFSHFFHFFAVFTGIFFIMTIIILQILRYGLYSSVDTALKDSVDSVDTYVSMTLSRSFSVETEGSNLIFNFDTDKKTKPSDKVNNVDVLLYDKDGNILNTVDAYPYSQFGIIEPDKKNLGEIVETHIQNSFGQDEKYHVITCQVSNEQYSNVKYATFLVSVRQLDEANDRFIAITISVMVIFWLISILASVYLANWTRKPILESYEKQKAFVENASHELRTPLAVLQNRLETLFRKPDATILDNSESIAASLDEVRNMRILTTNLLNLARRDDGLIPEISDLKATYFDDVFENYAVIAQENGKTFVGHNEVGRVVKTDKVLLKQLMTILFDNAIKYTEEKGLVDFTVKTTDKQLILRVADNGPGISDADKRKIFDRFYRVDKARTRQKGGFGLGLSLAQQIVQSLKGTITVKDNKPKGTIFEVKL